METKILGAETAYEWAKSNRLANMSISTELVIELVNRVEELEDELAKLDSALAAIVALNAPKQCSGCGQHNIWPDLKCVCDVCGEITCIGCRWKHEDCRDDKTLPKMHESQSGTDTQSEY